MGRFRRHLYIAAALMLSVHALGAQAFASEPVPEIDGGAISAGVALLVGGALLLRARRGSR